MLLEGKVLVLHQKYVFTSAHYKKCASINVEKWSVQMILISPFNNIENTKISKHSEPLPLFFYFFHYFDKKIHEKKTNLKEFFFKKIKM